MKHPLEKLAASALLAAATLGLSPPARACGGFFCSQAQPVNQAAERIIFADNGDGSVTAIIQILYDGPSESFSWLLPLSSVPDADDIGVASDQAFSRLQQATNPQYNLSTRVEGRCRPEAARDDSSFAAPRASGGSVPVDTDDEPGDAVTLEASGVVGAFEYAVISVAGGAANPVAPATDWLTQNGYDIPPGGAELIRPYLAEGMYLLALRLTKGSDVGSIRPLSITYTGSAPMIPIKLTAVAANQDMGVLAWVLSNARAVPFNYNALELNEARINWFNAASNYERVVIEAADEAGGQGFVTEFSGPSTQLASVIWSDGEDLTWQSIQSRPHQSLRGLFDDAFSFAGNMSGFWDVARAQVQPPEDIGFDSFRACPQCYPGDLQLDPSEFLAALDRDVIEPQRSVQRLIDRLPYTTRLYSTLSAAEMTLDPVFITNPDLPDVNNIHQATRVIECNPLIIERDASWRIEFPQGTTIRGTASSVGQWPGEADAQPPNQRVLTLGASGEGVVVADNSARIEQMLSDYNERVPFVESSNGDTGCSLGARSSTPRGAAFATCLALLGGAALWRRRRSRTGRTTR